MPRTFTSLALLGLAGAGMVIATPQEYDQETQMRDATCDNGCFDSSFPAGSCTDDAACMCTQQRYRENYFCCMGQKCAPHVLPDSIQRQTSECEARNMPFTFDSEAVCGIKLAVSTYVAPTVTVTLTAASQSSSASIAENSGSSSTITATPGLSSTGTHSASGTSSAASGSVTTTTPPPNGAPSPQFTMQELALAFLAPAVLFFW